MDELMMIKSTAEKLDTFLSSLSVEELRTLYRMNESQALNKYIIFHGKEKQGYENRANKSNDFR